MSGDSSLSTLFSISSIPIYIYISYPFPFVLIIASMPTLFGVGYVRGGYSFQSNLHSYNFMVVGVLLRYDGCCVMCHGHFWEQTEIRTLSDISLP